MGRPPICNCCGITTVFPTTTTIIPPTTPPPEYSCHVCLDGAAGTSCLDNLTQEECENIGGYWLPFTCGNSPPSFDLCPPPSCHNLDQEGGWNKAFEHNGSWASSPLRPIFTSNLSGDKHCFPDGDYSGGSIYGNFDLAAGALYFKINFVGARVNNAGFSSIIVRNLSTGQYVDSRISNYGIEQNGSCPCIDCGNGLESGGGWSWCDSGFISIPENGCYQIIFTASSSFNFTSSLVLSRTNIRPDCPSEKDPADKTKYPCETCPPSTTTTTTGGPTTTTTGGPTTTTTGGPTTSTTPCPYFKRCSYEWNGSSWVKISSPTVDGVDADCIATGFGWPAICPPYCDSCSCSQPNGDPGQFGSHCLTIDYSCCDCSIINIDVECPPTSTTTTTSEPTTSSPTSGPSGPTPDPLGPS